MPPSPAGVTDVSPLLQLLGEEKMQLTTRFTVFVSYSQTSYSGTQNVLKLRGKKKKKNKKIICHDFSCFSAGDSVFRGNHSQPQL